MYRLKVNNKIVTDQLVVAYSYLDRLKGLMFKKFMKFDVLMIKPCNSIHTYFMKINIDVLFVDNKNVVIHRMLDMKKGRFIMPIKNGSYVLESRAFFFKNISIGDSIEISKII